MLTDLEGIDKHQFSGYYSIVAANVTRAGFRLHKETGDSIGIVLIYDYVEPDSGWVFRNWQYE